MNVRELMTTKIEFVGGDKSVYDAIEKMVDRRIRSLLVKFSGKEDDCGVVTARDIVFNVLAKGINPMDLKISEIASRPIMCIEEDVDLYNAASMMVESNIARIFVRKGGEIIGVVSLIDIMAGSLIMRARR